MTKPQEILTPSLPQFVEEVVKLAKQGYRMHRDPEMLGWQYYCEMVALDVAVQEDGPEAVAPAAEPEVAPEAPKHNTRKTKSKATVEA